jgi:hypothetical protein
MEGTVDYINGKTNLDEYGNLLDSLPETLGV